MNPTEHSKLPFFAHLLESQNRQSTNEAGVNDASITGELSDDAMTLKFPSDRDEEDPFR